ncbi:D-aminoacyl-tRNA deacylase [Akkermansiaceae bacterium]|nr:D-aminoacyl-tRNA deacylase [Akkermansiaceae bacterium]
MRVVLQRVNQASVTVGEKLISEIEKGFLILLGIEEADGPDDLAWLIGKITRMRVFADAEGKMNQSLLDQSGEALVVSQFTLHASTRKGNRPSFIRAARPEQAEALYVNFCEALAQKMAKPVSKGIFGADMKVALVNDGPVTITMDSKNRE